MVATLGPSAPGGGLTIGAAGPLGAFVTLGANQTINVTNTATVDADGLLWLQGGSFDAVAGTTNNGEIQLDGTTAQLSGGTVVNSGLIHGNGRIAATLNNSTAGELRVLSGQRIVVEGAGSTNSGQINLLGGIVEIDQPFINLAAGQITGRGTLDVGGAGLTNNGHVALSSGISDIFGDLTNDTGSASIGITVSGNADVTFWDDVQNTSGRFQVSSGSSATFFGTLAGAGITGIGDVFVEADVTPGASPGLQNFGGNVHFGAIARLETELAGTMAGSQFDQVNIAGAATLDGVLDVVLINAFFPTPGETFEIMTFASHSGEFATVVVVHRFLRAELFKATWGLN